MALPVTGPAFGQEPTTAAEPPARPAEFLRLMNIGQAQLEMGDYIQAAETIRSALEVEPRSPEAMRNLARALMFSRKAEEAIRWLDASREIEPDSVAATYLHGLARIRLTQFQEAIPYLEEAARRDAHSAAIRFQLAMMYKAVERTEDATDQLREVLRLDPRHTAAHFQVAMHARRAGDTDTYRTHLREFTRLRDLYGDPSKTPIALEACIHTMAEAAPRAQAAHQTPPPSTIPVRFVDATENLFARPEDRSASCAVVVDVENDGRGSLFTLDPGGGAHLLPPSTEGPTERQSMTVALPPPDPSVQGIAGSLFDNLTGQGNQGAVSRHLTDILLVGDQSAHLLKRVAPDRLEEVTEAAGLAALRGRTVRRVDWENDGDLDLLAVGGDGLALWQNNGDETFSEIGESVGIPAGLAGTDVAAIDLDGNGAMDFIVARGDEPTLVFENHRAGRLAPMPEPPGPWPPARRILADDLNNDGYPDAVLAGADQATLLFGRSAERLTLSLEGLDISAMALIDYDNDGWLDLLAAGSDPGNPTAGRIRLWRNRGLAPWDDVTETVGLSTLELAPVRTVEDRDLDADGDTDLVLVTADSTLRFLRNEGGHENDQLKLRLFSLIMSNRGGVGTSVIARDGDFFLSRTVQRDGLVEIGLGARTELDSLHTVWPDGVIHNRTQVIPGPQPLNLTVIEFINTGSCPYLYAWDGSGFRFVTDLLGSGAVGLPLARGELEPVNPRELAVIGRTDEVVPHDGAYLLAVTSELRETDYLDAFAMLAVDHPPDAEVHSTDMLRGPPFPPSQVRALVNRTDLLGVESSDGMDRTAALRRIDGVFAPPGPVYPPPFRGICKPMSLTLNFGPMELDRPLVLALTGWIEYGTASSNIGLSQHPTAEVIWPTLEAETANGAWVALDDVATGMPAGKVKTVLFDLDGRLPPGTRRLRLTTTYELRWDRIALFESSPAEAVAHDLPITSAELAWRGFSDIRVRVPRQPPTPEFDAVSAQPPWYTALEGWYTRFGDVRDLLAREDGELVLINGGDAIYLAAPADALPPVPDGMVRTLFLQSTGWNKEGDPNTEFGYKVTPLPGQADNHEWRTRYNTRWVPFDAFRPAR